MLRLNGRLDRAGRGPQPGASGAAWFGRAYAPTLDSYPAASSNAPPLRALIHQPSVVLADEPTASLDTEGAYQVVETFAHLIHEQERAGVMVTHDLRMVKYVDRVIQMMDGHLSQIISDRAEIDALAAIQSGPLETSAGATQAQGGDNGNGDGT